MNKHHVILFLAGAALGYFAVNTLSGMQPWSLVANAVSSNVSSGV
jgi:hypothetical protein